MKMHTEITIAKAATEFLASLTSKERQESQQELNKFVRWCGMDRPLLQLTALEVANYAEGMEGSSANATRRVKPIRAFLSYAKKQNLTRSNLAIHLHVKKTAPIKRARGMPQAEAVSMTSEGYRRMEEELAALKEERIHIAETIRKAAADKDFRENAPLDAAKDQQGMVEAKIRDLEAALKTAVIAGERADSTKVALGSTVVLKDLSHDEELRYKLVNSREANPLKGKISVDSPTGQALLNRAQGEVIEVTAPAGTIKYSIERIEG